MKQLRQLWFCWWDVVVSYTLGRLIRPRGAKILFRTTGEAGGLLLQGYASVRSRHRNDRVWYIRAGAKPEHVYRARLADRGVTWVYGWDGPDADALRAQHLLVESIS